MSPDGGRVTLDGSGSTSRGSSFGTNDGIALFEWFDGFGTPGAEFLGEGETLEAVLGLGVHAITLQVTDRSGTQATDAVQVDVVDTTPPQLAPVPTPFVLWPPNHRMVTVEMATNAADVCGHVAVHLGR